MRFSTTHYISFQTPYPAPQYARWRESEPIVLCDIKTLSAHLHDTLCADNIKEVLPETFSLDIIISTTTTSCDIAIVCVSIHWNCVYEKAVALLYWHFCENVNDWTNNIQIQSTNTTHKKNFVKQLNGWSLRKFQLSSISLREYQSIWSGCILLKTQPQLCCCSMLIKLIYSIKCPKLVLVLWLTDLSLEFVYFSTNWDIIDRNCAMENVFESKLWWIELKKFNFIHRCQVIGIQLLYLWVFLLILGMQFDFRLSSSSFTSKTIHFVQ